MALTKESFNSLKSGSYLVYAGENITDFIYIDSSRSYPIQAHVGSDEIYDFDGFFKDYPDLSKVTLVNIEDVPLSLILKG